MVSWSFCWGAEEVWVGVLVGVLVGALVGALGRGVEEGGGLFLER